MTERNHNEQRRRIPPWAKKHWPNGTARKLNLACGTDYREGWTNVDWNAPRLDLKHDLLVFPWPLGDESYDFVLASHFLEHVPPTNGNHGDLLAAVLREISRVLKPGGTLFVRVPYKTVGFNSFWHYRYFDYDTFWSLKNQYDSSDPNPHRIRLEQVAVGAGERRFRCLGFDSQYHAPKYFGFRPRVGPVQEIIFVLRKP